MLVRPIEYGSPEYRAACELRRRFLREPLGLELTAADVAGEDRQHHFGLFDEPRADEATPGDLLLGNVIGKPDPDEPTWVRIRQMVVHGDRRGEGLGRTLLSGAERLLGERGFERFVLFARAEATPFYERCGYAATSDEVELIGLPHLRMEKR